MTPRDLLRAPCLLAFAALSLGGSVAGCGAVDNVFDCNSICTRYRDCFNSAYDVAACRTRCDSRGTASEAGRREVNRCESCINGASCTTAVFQCTAECSGIVP